jgi:hypothetical protein
MIEASSVFIAPIRIAGSPKTALPCTHN